ncbi:LacI family DNA-binding transcriptional regulator [Paenibacillus sp. M1]|uniref:LacI family DNA-binding transcriptional regulator n=1 Tax=Paenibacillus haidiansis TaxID=1574488 RepID=A0ABU7VNM2_9BACL
MKKTTMKDIAKAANVSVATVSYVLNRVANQTIPEETRSLIFNIAKELNYVPNLAARSLKKKTGLVGILINKDTSLPFWKQFGQHHFVDGLERLLTAAGYHTLLISLNPANPSMDVIVERRLDAVFLIDVKEEVFYSISSKFVEGVPLILIDSLIEDQLFNQILFDYQTALRQACRFFDAPPCLVMENYHNQGLVNFIRESSGLKTEDIFVIDNVADLVGFTEGPHRENVIVVNEFLGSYFERSNLAGNIAVICTCHCPEILSAATRKVIFRNDKCSIAFEMMKKLINPADYESFAKNRFLVEVEQ